MASVAVIGTLTPFVLEKEESVANVGGTVTGKIAVKSQRRAAPRSVESKVTGTASVTVSLRVMARGTTGEEEAIRVRPAARPMIRAKRLQQNNARCLGLRVTRLSGRLRCSNGGGGRGKRGRGERAASSVIYFGGGGERGQAETYLVPHLLRRALS